MRPVTPYEHLAQYSLFTGHELTVGRPLIARLSGRRFDDLLEQGGFDRPFDPAFGKAMLRTLGHLCAGLQCSFGFAEPHELSLFAVSGGGDPRRLMARIASEASARLSLFIGQMATFDCQLYEFPSLDLAWDYFQWRHQATYESTIDRYCIHLLEQSGADPETVPRILDGLGPDDKVEVIRQNGLEFASVPGWQRHGATVRLRAVQQGDSQFGRLLIDLNLPSGEAFSSYLHGALPAAP